MTSSTYTGPVIVLGDNDTGSRVEMLATRAAECGVAIAETHAFEPNQASSNDDIGEVETVITALCQAIRTRSHIWVPFPLDLVREQHLRRISLVLQRHGLNVLVGRELWPCPLDGGISEVDSALRREVRAVDDLDRAVISTLGVQTLTDAIELELQTAGHGVPQASEQLSDVLQQLEIQYGPHPGLPATRGAWRDRRAGLERFAGWLVHSCGMTRAEAAEFLNAFGHRTQNGRNWQRSTVSTLVNGRYETRSVA